MKKSLIALAVAGAVAAPVAMADSNVVVYGVANVSADFTNAGSNAAGKAGFSNTKMSSNTSRLGVKGNEDLGGGLTAVWQIESLISIDGGKNGAAAAPVNGLATRNTFAGLSGGFGTALIGRHDTPYKIATRSFDVFGDTIADNRAVMGGGQNTVTSPANGIGAATGAGASFDGRQTDVLAYVSPNMGGLTAIVAYVAGAEGQTLSTQTKGSAWSAAALYGNGPISVNAAYEQHNIGTAPGTLGAGMTKKESAWKVGAGYKLDVAELALVVEKTKDDFGAAGQNVYGHKAAYASAKFNINAENAIKAAYGKAGNSSGVNNGANQISVGFDHAFTKRTNVYALYTRLNNKSGGTYALSNAGIGNGSVYQNGAGASASAFSMGVKHSF